MTGWAYLRRAFAWGGTYGAGGYVFCHFAFSSQKLNLQACRIMLCSDTLYQFVGSVNVLGRHNRDIFSNILTRVSVHSVIWHMLYWRIGSDGMRTLMQATELMRSMVPMSRFDKGEAAKIFDEVAQTGIKIAVNNNKPACVLLSLERYEQIIGDMEDLEDFALLIETEKRLAEGGPFYAQDEVMQNLGITQSDLDAVDDEELE